MIAADCLDALNRELHHKPKYQTEPLEVRLHYYKNKNQWHDYELLARQALKLQVEPRDRCLWLTLIRHSCLMQKNAAAADKLYKEMSAQPDKKYKHKNNGWYVVMASDLFDAGDVDEAETAVNEGIELATREHENLSELLSTRAQIYDYRKLYDKEEADLKASFAAAKIREDKIGSLQSLEQLYIKQKRKAEATQVRSELTKAKGYLKPHGD